MPDDAIGLWDATAAEPAPPAHPLGAGPVDVAIVGGGYTGLSTALHCAEAGLSAQVIEAGAIGQGGSGRNVGLVNAGLWLPPDAVSDAAGAAFLQRFSEAPDRVFDLIETHQIRCEATRTGTIHAAHSAAGLRGLAARAKAWDRLGAPVTLLGADAVASLSGSRSFHGGLLDARAGTVSPMGYVRGLARAARGAGARIACGLPVTGLVRQGDRWRLDTAGGGIAAQAVVLATNAYTDSLWPGLDRGHATIRFVQVATEPLGEAAAHVLPERQGLWDTAPIMSSLRRDAEGRLILGSMGRLIGTAQAGVTQRWARAQLRRLFPELGDARFETAWDGRIAMTADHMPRILNPAPGVYAPTAYNGRGITTGTIFGQAIAQLLAGGDPRDLPLPLEVPRREPFGRLKTRAFDVLFAANQLWRGTRP